MFSSFLGSFAEVTGLIMIPVLMLTHILTTVRTGFIQRKLPRAIRLSFSNDGGAGDVSPFSSLMTALSATIGTGNIIGVATAVSLGGPGAVLWCWIIGILGMATKYSESLLAVRYRVREANGSYSGGAMYVLKNRLKKPKTAAVFAVLVMLCSFGIGSSVQANAITSIVAAQFGVRPIITAVIVSAAALAIILGGIKAIAKASGVIVPVMAMMYITACVIVIVTNRSFLPETFELILKSAFGARAMLGGAAGGGMLLAMRYGVTRGLFSSESGLGSAPIVAASAKVSDPKTQALISMTGTFWDTVVICALTGIVLVSEIVKTPALRSAPPESLTLAVFAKSMPFGGEVLSFSLVMFAFTTIIGWSHYGERAARYLYGRSEFAPKVYIVVYIFASFFGGIVSLNAVWATADILNAAMALPNILAIWMLSRELR